jgi:phage-related holin
MLYGTDMTGFKFWILVSVVNFGYGVWTLSFIFNINMFVPDFIMVLLKKHKENKLNPICYWQGLFLSS